METIQKKRRIYGTFIYHHYTLYETLKGVNWIQNGRESVRKDDPIAR